MNNLEKEMEYDKVFSSIKEEEIFKNGFLEKDEEGCTPPGSTHRTPSKDESGVLTYDEVKDIIQCLDFKTYDVKDRNVFTKHDHDKFNAIYRVKYANALFRSDVEIVMDSSNKSCSTKDSSSNKKNFISVIKNTD